MAIKQQALFLLLVVDILAFDVLMVEGAPEIVKTPLEVKNCSTKIFNENLVKLKEFGSKSPEVTRKVKDLTKLFNTYEFEEYLPTRMGMLVFDLHWFNTFEALERVPEAKDFIKKTKTEFYDCLGCYAELSMETILQKDCKDFKEKAIEAPASFKPDEKEADD